MVREGMLLYTGLALGESVWAGDSDGRYVSHGRVACCDGHVDECESRH
jgi:hypothetical protein